MPQERLQRRVAKTVLRHCQAQRTFVRDRKYRAPVVARGPGSIPVFLESARCIGAILGEKLYAAYIESRYSAEKIVKLYSQQIEGAQQARQIYLDLVSTLERVPLGHSSKLDLF